MRFCKTIVAIAALMLSAPLLLKAETGNRITSGLKAEAGKRITSGLKAGTGKSVVGDWHRVIVIPAEYADEHFTLSTEELQSIISNAEKYFKDQFREKAEDKLSFALSQSVTLLNNSAYYSSSDIHMAEAVKDALVAADPAVDFTAFEHIMVIVPGGSQADGAGADRIWPHCWDLSSAGINLKLDGKPIEAYSIFTEYPAGIGILCHEFGHMLGLKDFYDKDSEGSNGMSKGLWGSTSLMDRGSRNNSFNTPPNLNAIELEMLGLGEPVDMKEGLNTLQPIGNSQQYMRIDTPNEGEYFLLECRKAEGWDTFIGGEGMLIYHIDRSGNEAGFSTYWQKSISATERWEKDEVNYNPEHECAALVAAWPETESVDSVFFPCGSRSSFGPNSKPRFVYWDGGYPELSLSHIRRNDDGSVSFFSGTPLKLVQNTILQDAILLEWVVSEDIFRESSCTLSVNGWSTQVQPFRKGRFAYTLERLKPATSYSIEIEFKGEDGSAGLSLKTQATTLPFYEGLIYPYIYLDSTSRNDDGSFKKGAKLPLRVCNAVYARSVSWSFNGSPISVGSDCKWQLSGSGTLTAEVVQEDGNTLYIEKEITVSEDDEKTL